MKFPLFVTLRNYKLKYLPKDIISGIIVAAMTIPISMGYAQVCGMPAVYGLYGSVFPILIFAMFSTSPQFIFGVDAAPCAVVGAFLSTHGIAAASQQATEVVPLITLFAGLWLLLFSILKAGKLVNFISTPVMGGFISGIAATIILMQVPKLLGSSSGNGELFELAYCIYKAATNNPSWISFVVGILSVALILISKKFIPKFPMIVAVMIASAISTAVFHIDQYGIKLLDSVDSGLPTFSVPHIALTNIGEILGTSLTVALIVLAQTLLAENNFALKNGYKINDNREVLTFSLALLTSAFTGGVPVNGSVSRTGAVQQYGGKSQVVSLVSGASIILLLLFGTDFIAYLPVPVLTGIVMSALIGIIQFDVAKRLIKSSHIDAAIFFAAFFGVLLLGTIYGVLIGMILSFVVVIIRVVNPSRTFLGIIPDKDGFFDLNRNKDAQPIENTVIYRFNGNLFFANISVFQSDIEQSINEHTKAVIVDAGGITHIDITAADRLVIISNNLKSKGIDFYITEHIGQVNDLLRKYGAGSLIDEGHIRRTITIALKNSGILPPYKLEKVGKSQQRVRSAAQVKDDSLHEYEWAYGDDAEKMMNKTIDNVISGFRNDGHIDLSSGNISENASIYFDENTIIEDEILAHIEHHPDRLSKYIEEDEEEIIRQIEKRRLKIKQHILKNYPKSTIEVLAKHRADIAEHLKEKDPELYKQITEVRSKIEREQNEKQDK